MKTSLPKIIDNITYRRIHFTQIRVGDRLVQMEPTAGGTPVVLGEVIETTEDAGGNRTVALDSGKRLTRRGWQSKRLWKNA